MPASAWVQLIPNDPTYGLILFDGTVSEAHKYKADVTEYPVEQGSDITDNIRPKPFLLSCVVTVTNTPADSGGPASLIEGYSPSFPPVILDSPSVPLAAPYTPGGLYELGLTALASLFPNPPTKVNPLQWPEKFDLIALTETALAYLLTAGVVMSVATSTLVFENMVLDGVDLDRKEFGSGEFTLSLKRIQTVSSSTVPAPRPSVKSGVPPVTSGSQTSTAGTPVQKTFAAAASDALVSGHL